MVVIRKFTIGKSKHELPCLLFRFIVFRKNTLEIVQMMVFCTLALLFFFTPVLAQNRVYAEVEVKRVMKGQSVTIRKEIFYSANGKMIVRFTYPEEYYLVTNNFGEARIYHPKTNEVMLINDRFMSSESEPLYYFLTNKIEDMGLKSLGFTLTDTRTERNNIIRTYTPNDSKSNISKIELVHENHLPIYCAYYDSKNRVEQKVYYSDYQMLSFTAFPGRITEISYVEANDSIVSRMLYSNVKVDRNAVSPFFDFSIPSDAKIVDNKLFQPNRRR